MESQSLKMKNKNINLFYNSVVSAYMIVGAFAIA